jgi:hypothetical protein
VKAYFVFVFGPAVLLGALASGCGGGETPAGDGYHGDVEADGDDGGGKDGGAPDGDADAEMTDRGGDAETEDARTTDAGGDAETPDTGPDAETEDAGGDGGTADDGGFDGGADAGVVNRFGVIQGRIDPALITGVLLDLGGGWIRMNAKLDGKDVDVAKLLDAGLNVVLTISNENPANADNSACGCAPGGKACERAAFPFKSKAAYQADVKTLVSPLVPHLAAGRRLMVQCENEVVPNGAFWCGDETQYLAQLDALHDAVKSVDPSIAVVLTGFATRTLDALIDPTNPSHAGAGALANLFLSQGKYDAADLHFYGCVADIAEKVKWFADRLAPGKLWISTENGGPDYRCAADKGFEWPNPDAAAWEAEQAAQVSARLSACAGGGGEVCLWFSLFDMSGEDPVFSHLGLLEEDPPYRKKPAYDAFRRLIAVQ